MMTDIGCCFARHAPLLKPFQPRKTVSLASGPVEVKVRNPAELLLLAGVARVSTTQFLFPAKDSSRITFFFGFFDFSLRLIEHRQARVSENVVGVDFYESAGGRDCLIEAAGVEQSHAEPVQGILIIGIDLEGLSVFPDGIIKFVVAESINSLLEV